MAFAALEGVVCKRLMSGLWIVGFIAYTNLEAAVALDCG